MPGARGTALPIARVPASALWGRSMARLVKGPIPLGPPETADPYYSASSKLTLVLEINPSVSGLCSTDLDQDMVFKTVLPGVVSSLGTFGFIISLFGLVVFLSDMLKIPSYPGRAESAVNLDTSPRALEQPGTQHIIQ